MLNVSALQKWQMSGEMFLCPKVLHGGRILLSKFQTLTSSIVEIISLTILKPLLSHNCHLMSYDSDQINPVKIDDHVGMSYV